MSQDVYIHICQELIMIESYLAELPNGCIKHKKNGKYVEHYYRWYENGVRKVKYVKKADFAELELKLAQRVQLANRKTHLLELKDYYADLLRNEGLDPDQIVADIQQQQLSLEEHYKQWRINIDSDYYHNNENVTLKGENVRSRAEVIIANILYMNHIDYKYEEVLTINGETVKPDFTIYHNGRVIYWEHAGGMNNEAYRNAWELKKRAYSMANIIEGKNLIVTYEHYGIDSIEIQYLIDRYILRR